MKKFYIEKKLLIISVITICIAHPTNAQVVPAQSNSLNKISVINKNWQEGGIFKGESPEKEILAARTEYTKKFEKGNGVIDLIFGGPFHYTDRNGALQDIDLHIKQEVNGLYGFKNNENRFVSDFAQEASGGVKMEYKKSSIGFGINTSVAAPGWSLAASINQSVVTNENIITYKNFYRNVDIEYELTTDAVVHRMKFNNNTVFSGLSLQPFLNIEETIELPVNGFLSDENGPLLTGRKVKGNLFVIVNTDTLYTILNAHAWDASFKGDILETGLSNDLPNGVIGIETSVSFLSQNKIKLIASIPVSWLLASERIYPIVFDPTVGIGNQSSFSSLYRYPFNTCRQQRVSQYIFRKADINAGGITTTGNIVDIAFFQNTPVPIPNNNVKISMKEISAAAFSNPTLESSGSLVYGPSNENFTSGSNTWRTLTLATPFAFTNTNNLFIEVRFTNSSLTAGCTCSSTAPGGYWGYFNSSYAGHRWAYSNSAATPPSGTDCEYNNSPERNPAYGYFIPATRITINTAGGCVPVTFTNHPSSQTVVAPAQAQFTVAVSGTTPTYQWEMSTNGGASWSNVPAGAPYSGVTSNQLTINPTSAPLSNNRYRCKATNSCTPSPVTSNTAVLTINAAGCGTVVTPVSSPSIPAAGGGGSFTINVTPNTCSWSASETLTWVTITSPLNGTGDGILTYTVAANTGGPRSGTITVNGQSHTINQLGAAAPTTYTISGRVVENSSTGLPNVIVSTTPAQGTTTTDALGYYSLNVPLAYTGTVKATLAPYTFTPLTRPVSSASFSNKDFDAMGVSINIQPSSSIYPWQREGEDIAATINVSMGTTTTNWRVKADVYDANNVLTSVPFPPATGLTYTINTGFANLVENQTLKALCKNGSRVEYIAIYIPNPSITDTIGSTNIIEKKWDKKNVVYWRDPTSPDIIRIPVKWSATVANQAAYIKIKRFNGTSWILPDLASSTQGEFYSSDLYDDYPYVQGFKKYPLTIKNNFGVNQFNIDPTSGYCEIKGSNSNIYSNLLFPGDFKFEIYNNQGNVIEQGYFDLTKIGHIKGPAASNKIMIVVGGILNEAELSADSLRIYDATLNTSNYTYSLIEYVRNSVQNYSTWYIAQGNSNSVERNGYDIGLAIERIRKLNNIQSTTPNSEIDIICHSKGGLDVRALLSIKNNSTYLNKSINGVPFSFKDSAISSIIKKVVFLGSPHLGAPIENLLSSLNLVEANSPGAQDLKVNSNIIASLSSSNVALPNSIKYCNVTGFSLYSLVGLGDLVVPEISSLSISTPQNTKLQLRQVRLPLGSINHFSIHKSNILDYRPAGQAAQFMCYSGITNLDKIKNFIQSGDISQTCNTPVSITNIHGLNFYKSKVSNAKVYLQTAAETFFLGTTDSDGSLFYQSYLTMSTSDSLSIVCSGVDSIKIPYSTVAISNMYINRIASFKSPFDSNKILYPVFNILNETPITQTNNIHVYIGGKNISQVFINIHNSDDLFTPLTVTNGIAMVGLDTGYNKLLIKLKGIDSVVLKKEIFYLPSPYINEYTRDLGVTVGSQYGSAKMYVNNKYYSIMNSGVNIIKIFKDNNEIRFSRFGYWDTIYKVDSSMGINLIMPIRNYSSLTDSIIFNFNNRPNPQYWKTITVKSLTASSNKQLSAMQYDDAFTGMSLKPQTRKFVFRRLNSAVPASFKTAIALDQILTPDKDSVYLLNKKGNNWTKYPANQAGTSEYDTEVQKLAFDKLYFDFNETQEIVLMQKQAPIMKTLDTIWHSGQTIAFPMSIFVADPDSIRNDLSISSTDIKVTVSGNMVYITAPINFTGITTYNLTGTHDFLDVNRTYTMKVIPPEVYIPTAFSPNNDGLNDLIRPIFLGKLVNCHFMIFNRGGQKVFDTKDCFNGWDGRIKGTVQDPGGYVYYLTYQFEGETEKNTRGSFVLIK